MNIEKEFEEEFCYTGESYAKGNLKWSRELKGNILKFIQKALSDQKKEIRDWIEKNTAYRGAAEEVIIKKDLIKFLDA
jgi:hypothetical protein